MLGKTSKVVFIFSFSFFLLEIFRFSIPGISRVIHDTQKVALFSIALGAEKPALRDFELAACRRDTERRTDMPACGMLACSNTNAESSYPQVEFSKKCRVL